MAYEIINGKEISAAVKQRIKGEERSKKKKMQ